MFKKTMVATTATCRRGIVMIGIILLSGVVFAQTNVMEELHVKHNEFSVAANFINMKPINEYIEKLGLGFTPPFNEMPLLFGYTQKNKIDDKTYWGIKFMTTLSGFAVLEPNFLKKELSSVLGSNKAEMSITTGEFLLEYEVLKFGGFAVNAGVGLGFGGTTLTLLGNKSGKFWMASFLLKPQARASYHLFENTGAGVIFSLTTAYNYLPAAGWNFDAGNLEKAPGLFDLSGFSIEVGIDFPFTTK